MDPMAGCMRSKIGQTAKSFGIHSLMAFGLCSWIALAGCQPPQATGGLPLPEIRPAQHASLRGTNPKIDHEPPSPAEPVKSFEERVIIVDAGHGGKDPGTQGGKGMTRYPEKVIVLRIANLLAESLKQDGFRVIMTRTSDRFVELEDRASFAERYNADLLISIHCNANRKKNVSGATVYVSRSASARSERIANLMCGSISRVIPCIGVGRGNYKVLVNHSKPSVLVECGYLTNPGDARRLNQSGFQEDLAEAMAGAIRDAFSR